MNTFDIYKFLIIPHDSKFLNLWVTVESILCLLTSFTYAWIAHFGIEKESELFIYVIEFIFTLQILSKFMTSFIPEGELFPETNHAVIAKRYIGGDFIPWIPLFIFMENE